ncbi:MAG: hypothetical protein WD708_06840 [Kiritimatiellia bacterium]
MSEGRNILRVLTLNALALASRGFVFGAEIPVLDAGGVYDEQTQQANAVDVNAADAMAFQDELDTAFPAGRGGVVAFEDLADGTLSDVLHVRFAADTKTLSLRDGGSSTGFESAVVTSRTPISGSRALQASDDLQDDGNKNDWVLHFGPVVGGELGEAVTSVAFTVLGRDGTARVLETITVTYDNGEEDLFQNLDYTGKETADTFVRFDAPAGRSIRSLVISNTGYDFTSLDDLGFLTSVLPPSIPALLPYTGDYRQKVMAFADAMMTHGRDTYGTGNTIQGDPKQSGLFLSALDRTAVGGPRLIDTSHPAAPPVVREHDRVIHLHREDPDRRLYGSDLGDNQALLRLMLDMSAESGNAAYRQAARDNLAFTFRNARSGKEESGVTTPTGLLGWGEHLSWDVVNDQVATGYYTGRFVHEFTDRFEMWETVYDLTPADAEAYTLALWTWQINNPSTGDYDRHGNYDGQYGLSDEFDFPRHGGYYLHTWAAALKWGGGANQTLFRNAIQVLIDRFEGKIDNAVAAHGVDHGLIHLSDNPRDVDKWSPAQTLDLASSCSLAAEMIDPSRADPLAQNLLQLAQILDASFLAQAHDPAGAGFVSEMDIPTLQVRGRSREGGLAYGEPALTHVFGRLMSERARLLEGRDDPVSIQHRESFQALALAAADRYLTSEADRDRDGDYHDEQVWALEFGVVIELLLDAHEWTGDLIYLRRARYFGDLAVTVFWESYDLPRAGTDTQHYEAITGSGDLARALFRLHREILRALMGKDPIEIQRQDSGHRIRLQSMEGARYRLAHSPDFAAWTGIAEQVAAGSELFFPIEASPGVNVYRVEPLPNL